jgi:hypothetical protein
VKNQRERVATCERCYATITVVGPRHHDDEALHRADWDRVDGRVTCRRCLRKAAR